MKLRQKKMGILLFPQFEDLDVFGPWEVFAAWSRQCEGPDTLLFVSESGEAQPSTKGISLKSDVHFQTCPPLDYLLIPGGLGSRKERYNSALIDFIQQQSQYTECILSVCTGALILEQAGLLKGKMVTTHLNSIESFRHHQECQLKAARWVKNDGLWLSAGVSAGIDMALAFIADTAGKKVAGSVQLLMEYYPAGTVYPNNQHIYPPYLKK